MPNYRDKSLQYRDKYNLKQTELALLVGVHQSLIAKIERGDRVSKQTAKKLDEVFANEPNLEKLYQTQKNDRCKFVIEMNPEMDITQLLVDMLATKQIITLDQVMLRVTMQGLLSKM